MVSRQVANEEQRYCLVMLGVENSGHQRCIELRSRCMRGSKSKESKVPFRIVLPVLVRLLCPKRFERGGTVKGVPCACWK